MDIVIHYYMKTHKTYTINNKKKKPKYKFLLLKYLFWSWWADSNRRPADYELNGEK